jgi:transcriptional regulator with XRE-family HTH domain
MDPTTQQGTTFGAWLDHAVRTRRGPDGEWLSQRKLAAAVGVQAPAINKIIAGRTRPSAEVVIRIANYLNADVSELLRLAGYEPPRPEMTLPTPDSPAKVEMIELVREVLADKDAEREALAISAMIRAFRRGADFSGGGGGEHRTPQN